MLPRPRVLQALPLIFCLIIPARMRAQSSANGMPQWEIDAGGKGAFEVASVKQNTADPFTATSNIPLGPRDAFTPTGGLFNATNQGLVPYMVFAYKLNPNQVQDVMSQLPKWALMNRYDIEGRVAGNPTKDQFRLMMQALLAERFRLALHFETRQLPVYAVVLDKPGKFGPQFRMHPASDPCSTAPTTSRPPVPATAEGFPLLCGVVAILQPSSPARMRAGSRNLPIENLAAALSTLQQSEGADRPMVNRTGLAGSVDFFIEWQAAAPPGANTEADPVGPTFLQALKEQLGLKLEATTGPVDVLVIDHIEEPTAN